MLCACIHSIALQSVPYAVISPINLSTGKGNIHKYHGSFKTTSIKNAVLISNDVLQSNIEPYIRFGDRVAHVLYSSERCFLVI